MYLKYIHSYYNYFCTGTKKKIYRLSKKIAVLLYLLRPLGTTPRSEKGPWVNGYSTSGPRHVHTLCFISENPNPKLKALHAGGLRWCFLVCLFVCLAAFDETILSTRASSAYLNTVRTRVED